jgi:hypothetical protein
MQIQRIYGGQKKTIARMVDPAGFQNEVTEHDATWDGEPCKRYEVAVHNPIVNGNGGGWRIYDRGTKEKALELLNRLTPKKGQ